MNIWDIAILSAVIIMVALAVRRLRKDKKAGKSCGCGCEGCTGCASRQGKPPAQTQGKR